MPYKDKEKKRQYSKQWRKDNPEYREYRKEYRATPENKEKQRQRDKKWYAIPENKEKKRQWQRQRRSTSEYKEQQRQYSNQYNAIPENKEKKRQCNKKWYACLDNKEKRSSQHRNRYQIDPMYRLNSNIHGRIYQSLCTNNLSKNKRHWEDLVGYTIQELKTHLEQQFDLNMNWNNYGMHWHLDHIIPLSSLTFSSIKDENFKFLWSLGNLQPLYGPENLSKNSKILINFYPLLFPFTIQFVKDKY